MDKKNTASTRRGLLASVSAFALLGATTATASAEESDRPVLWLELGGQVERLSGAPELFAPPFFAEANSADLAVMTDAQRPPTHSFGSEGKLTFAPEGTDWLLSASIRIGRSSSGRHLHHQSELPPHTGTKYPNTFTVTPDKQILGDAQADFHESHTVLDFQAGKDVGLGLFGGKSTLSAGVRFAQFRSSSEITMHARPIYGFDPPFGVPGKYSLRNAYHNTYTAIARSQRSLRAVGPSLSWNGSSTLAGNEEDGAFTFDWGVNAAVLFGRQRTHVHHQTTGYRYHKYGNLKYYSKLQSHYVHPADPDRSRSVTVPNLGGFAGASLKFSNAKISLGYRADFFFGAMDGGIDTRKSTMLGFHGPFASISVGVGD